MGKFKSINYSRVVCEDCGEATIIEPGTEFSGLNCNCGEKPKLDDTEISKPVQQELDYVKTQTVIVIGIFKNGDYEVCNNNDLNDTWRVPKNTFESTYEKLETPKGNINETPTTNADTKQEITLSLEDIKGRTPENITVMFSLEELRTLAKSCKIRGYTNMGKDKLIGKLLAKVE